MVVAIIKDVQKHLGRLRTSPKSREWEKERSIMNMLSMNLFLVIDMRGYWNRLTCFFSIAKGLTVKMSNYFPIKNPIIFTKPPT